MNIGVIYDIVRWEEKAIIEAIRDKGHKPILFHVDSLSFKISSKIDFNNIDIAIQRCVSYYKALTSTLIFEENGVYVVNPSPTLTLCSNKLQTTLRLAKNGIPVPETYIAFTKEQASKIPRKLGYPIVLKPILGSWGRLLAKVNDDDALSAVFEHRDYMYNPIYKIYYIQEYINKPGRDIRVFTIGDEVPVAIYRVSKHWKTNTALGGKAVKAEVTDELRDLAFKTSKAIGGGILGIDILEDPKRGFLVNEVNAVIEFRNTVRVTGVKLQSLIVGYLIKEARR